MMKVEGQVLPGLGKLAVEERQTPVPVLQIVSTLQMGGGESVVATLARSLPTDRFSVDICCLHREGPLADALRREGINVIWLKMRTRYWPISLFQLVRLIKQKRIQVVHTHLHPADKWGRLAAILAGVPVIINTEHNLNTWRNRYHRSVERVLNHYTSKVIAVSEDIRQLRIHSEGMPPEKIITIPNAVDISKFSQVESRDRIRAELGIEPSVPLVGTVARLYEQKRIDRFLQAASMVRKTIPDARFIIAGDGPLREGLIDLAERLDLMHGPVQFLGHRKDVPDLLAAMDIFVLSSDFEGMPISILEAMAAGKAIVATRVGGNPEVIQDGVNGKLVPVDEPHSLARAVVELIEDPILRASMASQGFKSVNEEFSVPVFSQRTAALYDSLLEVERG